jgi:hypothetical protein
LAYSTNGLSFTGIGTSVFSTSCRAVIYSDQLCLWVAVGTGTNRIAYSEDGVTWTGSATGNAIITGTGFGVHWSSLQSTFVAGGSTAGGAAVLAVSGDGVNWVQPTTSTFSTMTQFSDITFSTTLNRWLAVGSHPTTTQSHYTTSTPYGTWTSSANGFTGINFDNGACYSDPLSLFTVTTTGGAAGSSIGVSSTGTNGWTMPTAGNCPAASVNKCEWGANRFMFASNSPATLYYTNSAGTGATITCTAVTPAVFTTAGNNVGFSAVDTIWVAVGSGTNSIAYSTDNGVTFTGLGTSVFSTAGFAIHSTGSYDSFKRSYRNLNYRNSSYYGEN